MSFFLLLTLITGANSSEWGEIEQTRTWKSKTPIVQRCNDANIDIEVVYEAVDYWRKRGHTFKAVKTSTTSCSSTKSKKGYIVIAGERNLDTYTYNGKTLTFVYNDDRKELSYAFIRLASEHKNNVELLKHEIGHALGYEHSDNPDHLMHEYQDL